MLWKRLRLSQNTVLTSIVSVTLSIGILYSSTGSNERSRDVVGERELSVQRTTSPMFADTFESDDVKDEFWKWDRIIGKINYLV